MIEVRYNGIVLLQLAETMGYLDENEKPVISNKIIKTIKL